MREAMNVLQLNVVCGIRSTGRICAMLSDALEARGDQCNIAYGRFHVPPAYKDVAVKIGSRADSVLHGLKSRLWDGTGFGSRRATQRFVQWLRENPPDVIHLHNLHGYYLHLGVLVSYLKECGKPIIWTLHDCWPMTGHCTYFEQSGCDKWRTQCDNCPQQSEYPASWMDRSAQNFLKKRALLAAVPRMTLVTPSHWLAECVRDSFLREYPLRVIPNGVDLHRWKPCDSTFRSSHGLQDRTIVLSVASVWDARKNAEDLFQLADMLGAKYQVVMVGQYAGNVPKNVIHITHTDSARALAELYTAADVLVNPTLEDNFPTVNLEALACGTPVITYKTGGSPETIDETCGVVVAERTPAALADAVRAHRGAWSVEACLRRAATLDAARTTKAYLALYDEC